MAVEDTFDIENIYQVIMHCGILLVASKIGMQIYLNPHQEISHRSFIFFNDKFLTGLDVLLSSISSMRNPGGRE